jgi:peptidoglycan/xylan/chitin deacetylase (PgdA/CDA1 family)
MPESCVFLMYHELELAGRKLCQSEPGYVRYILPLETFRSQMAWLKDSGWRGLNVSEALDYFGDPTTAGPTLPRLSQETAREGWGNQRQRAVCITFDDGCETDWIAAAPMLAELGFHATSYVTAGFLGQDGYLSTAQLRELDSTGFEIGCHSMTHAYLSDISELELKHEIVDAKDRIEQILGHAIQHFSCPGGRYDERSLATARSAGFKTVANSDFHANSTATPVCELGRIAILRDLPLARFGAICRGDGLWRMRMQYRTRRSIQRLLGNRGYDRLRAAVLGKNPQ